MMESRLFLDMRHFLTFLSLAFLPACHGKINSSDITVSAERIEIPISAEQLNEYPLSHIFESSGRTFFAGYNHLLHRIDIFDLDSRTFTESIALELEGPDGVAGFYAMKVVTPETIFIMTHVELLLLNRSRIVKRIALDSQDDFRPVPNVSDGLVVSDDSIVFFNNLIDLSLEGDAFMRQPVLGWLDAKSGEQKVLAADFPDMFRSHFYGDKSFPGYALADSLLLYNFNMDSRIYVLNLISGVSESYDLPSHFTANTTQATSRADFMDLTRRVAYNTLQLHFYSPIYDTESGFIYRIYHDRVEAMSDIAGHLYMTVLTRGMKFVTELKLEGCRSNARPYDHGLIFPVANPENESTLSFMHYQFYWGTDWKN